MNELPPNAPPAGAPFNYALALNEVGGETELLDQLIVAFLEQTPTLMARLQTAIDAGIAADVRMVAHALKGSVAIFGRTTVHPLAAEIEALGRDGKLDALSTRWPILQAHVQQLVTVLTKILEERAA